MKARDERGLLAWLSNRASRQLVVAASADLVALRPDVRVVASGVSHPASNLDDARIVEGYVSVDDLPSVVSDYWLELPLVDERHNVVLHVAPIRPHEVGPLLLAADLAEHGSPREAQRASELLNKAMDELDLARQDRARV